MKLYALGIIDFVFEQQIIPFSWNKNLFYIVFFVIHANRNFKILVYGVLECSDVLQQERQDLLNFVLFEYMSPQKLHFFNILNITGSY